MVALFPNFNIYSTPLLILVIQGIVFAFLLFQKYYEKKYIPNVLLGLILLITCWHRTTYTIGFMGWYDTFRNTKVNYYLVPLSLALAPLLFLYVRSITVSGWQFTKKHIYHFIPFILYFLYRVWLVIYDMNQVGFDETQNGVMMENLHDQKVEPIYTVFQNIQMILYLAFTFQAFYQYKRKIVQYYSNTYTLELNWLRNFLFIYAFLYVYSLVQILINDIIVDLHWTQKWWYHFFSGLAIIYVGIKGYFTNTDILTDLEFNEVRIASQAVDSVISDRYKEECQFIRDYFESHKPYLEADLNLKSLARNLPYSANQLSEIINKGFNLNFNDFINNYRVEAVKKALKLGKQKDMSLVGIAMDCGFNSKPTFNRVFKKLVGATPTDYASSLKY